MTCTIMINNMRSYVANHALSRPDVRRNSKLLYWDLSVDLKMRHFIKIQNRKTEPGLQISQPNYYYFLPCTIMINNI